MSSLIKSAINYRVSAFVNFKPMRSENGNEYEIASINPKIQYKDKNTNAYVESKYWSLEEAQAMIGVLQRAIRHAEERLQPIVKTAGKKEDQSSHAQAVVKSDVTFDDSEIPF